MTSIIKTIIDKFDLIKYPPINQQIYNLDSMDLNPKQGMCARFFSFVEFNNLGHQHSNMTIIRVVLLRTIFL
jgi:hypothetical protein